MDSVDAFRGNERYEVIRRLGRGGFGVVYEVLDKVRGDRLALKTLRSMDGESLFHLKREFRTVADLSHPNLVSLYELSAMDELWFYTMELVDGSGFLDFVRVQDKGEGSAPELDFYEQPTVAVLDEQVGAPEESSRQSAAETTVESVAGDRAVDETKLRSVLYQLSQGLYALHAAGVLHRDIKPSNILVSREGLIKIADFGLSTGLGQNNALEELAGTVGYIAPELLWGEPAEAASDWYSIGIILYEALSGRLPFEGSVHSAITKKISSDPPDIRECVSDAPEDLCELCMELIQRIPKKRPTGDEVLRRLARESTEQRTQAMFLGSAGSEVLVGRQDELETIRSAFSSDQRSWPFILRIAGQPGVGKSSIIRGFLREIESRGDHVILSGRCYQRESVPYRAVDSLMDALSTFLRGLEVSLLTELLPRDVQPLLQVFPVMERVAHFADVPVVADGSSDIRELRLRAFRALRALLWNLARRFTLVIWLDDLQWSDEDSAALLTEVLSPPKPPPIFLIATHRSSDGGLPHSIDRAMSAPGEEGVTAQIELEDLSAPAALRLAESLLRNSGQEKMASAIARESLGNPFFLIMLVSHVMEQSASLKQGVTLEEVIEAQVRALPAEARRLLSVASLSFRQPLPLELARGAAGLEVGFSDAIELLRSRRMLSALVGEEKDEIQFFHDRIRECVVAGLEKEQLQSLHLDIARAVNRFAPEDNEALAAHLIGARETKGAATAIELAASMAEKKLAFERAAVLYRRALELVELPWVEERRLRIKLGDALRNAGYGAEAAHEYLTALPGAEKDEELELRRRAVEQLLLSGHTIEGKKLMRSLLTELGIQPARTRHGVFYDIAFSQLLIRIQELRWQDRSRWQISDENRLRLDTTYSVTWGLSLIEPVEARALQRRHLLDAFKFGDEYTLTRALLAEVALETTLGELRPSRRSSLVLERCKEMVDRLDHPYTTGLWLLTRGVREFFAHRFAEASRVGDEAGEYFRRNTRGAAAERMMLQLFTVCSLFYLGELQEFRQRVQTALRQTRAFGDLVGSASMTGGVPLAAWLMDDDLEGARARMEETGRALGPNRFAHVNYWDMFSKGMIALYGDRPVAGLREIEESWGSFMRSGMYLLPASYVPTLHLRGLLAVGAAARGAGRRARSDASRCARRLEARSTLPGAMAMACFIRAALEHQRERKRRAGELLRRAEFESEKHGLGCFAEIARLRQGTLLSGARGREMERLAWSEIAARGVVRPDSFARLVSTGLPEPRYCDELVREAEQKRKSSQPGSWVSPKR